MAITNYDMQMMAHKKREVSCLDRIATALEVIAASTKRISEEEMFQHYWNTMTSSERNNGSNE